MSYIVISWILGKFLLLNHYLLGITFSWILGKFLL